MGCGDSSRPLEKVQIKRDKVNVLFILGGPASGKGTLCDKIKTEFNYTHKSSGDILRAIVSKQEHPQWKELKEKMDKGEFVSSVELMGFIKEEFKSLKGEKVLLDGFPRNKENLDEWNKSIRDEVNELGLVYLDCPKDIMQERSKTRAKEMAERGEAARGDDNEDTMLTRINNFFKDTVPIVKEYGKSGNVIKINAQQSKDAVFGDFSKQANEIGL